MWKKMVTPTALISLLWLLVGGITFWYWNWVFHSHLKYLEGSFTTIQATNSMRTRLWKLQATVAEIAERADSQTRVQIAQLELEFEKNLAQAEASCTTPETQSLVATIRSEFARYRENVQRRLERSSGGKRSPSVVEMARASHVIADSCESLLNAQTRIIAKATEQRSQLGMALGQLMVALWIAGPAVGIAWGLWIGRRIRRSISQVSISLRDAAGGLDHEIGRVDVSLTDEIPGLQQQVQFVSSRIKEVVDRLQQARHETVVADRLSAVGELAASMAHELRNPLTSVKLLIQAAAEGPPGPSLSEEHLHVVLEQIVRMESTIQGLLDFARPPEMQKVCHDLRDTLRRTLNLMEGYAKQHRVAVVEEVPAEPVFVEGDPEQLNQVFVNLLLNGVDSMPEGGSLQVALCRIPGSPGCQVVFRDSGTGIPPSILERLFEPFVTDKQRGTGLGLAISRRIVEQHGGKLMGANGPAGGAVFTVELPYSCDEEPSCGEPTATHRDARPPEQPIARPLEIEPSCRSCSLSTTNRASGSASRPSSAARR